VSFYDKNCCVYRLTNILLYWYNTTGWLSKKRLWLVLSYGLQFFTAHERCTE